MVGYGCRELATDGLLFGEQLLDMFKEFLESTCIALEEPALRFRTQLV